MTYKTVIYLALVAVLANLLAYAVLSYALPAFTCAASAISGEGTCD